MTIDLSSNAATGGYAQGDTFSGIERVLGSRYDDSITSDSSANYLRGFLGNDTLAGGVGNDILRGDQGADHLDGGAGVDWAHYSASNAAVTIDLGSNTGCGGHAQGDTFSDVERVLGSRYDDSITGDDQSNYLRGNLGDDTIAGGAGNDILRGDQGADQLEGGVGLDWAYYSASNAAVTINLDANTASGGHAQGDTFSSVERVLGSRYDDSITGDGQANYLRGFLGNDTLSGGASNDILQGDQGADSLNGGAGLDWAYYSLSNAAVTIDLGTNTATGGHAQGDTFSSIERVLGSQHDDSITGDEQANYLRGNAGDDTLAGGGGNDLLRGDQGADMFEFAINGGYDRILDFADNEDKIQIEGFDFDDVTTTNESDGALIDYGGGEIKLSGVDASIISESDFVFV